VQCSMGMMAMEGEWRWWAEWRADEGWMRVDGIGEGVDGVVREWMGLGRVGRDETGWSGGRRDGVRVRGRGRVCE